MSAFQRYKRACSMRRKRRLAVRRWYSERPVPNRRSNTPAINFCNCRTVNAGGRVAPGGCLPGAPTDPYVHALVHTVPPIRGSLRERTPSGPPSLVAADTAAIDD